MPDAEEQARRLYAAINAHDIDGIVACWAPGGIERVPLAGELRAPEGIEAFARELFAAIPDYRLEVTDLLADRDRVIARFRAYGTFTGGPLFGLRATSKPWRSEGIDVIRFEDDLIAELDVYSDPIATARASGIVPDRPAIDRLAMAVLNLVARIRRR
jgi:ketosteroid isomerase-like protein